MPYPLSVRPERLILGQIGPLRSCLTLPQPVPNSSSGYAFAYPASRRHACAKLASDPAPTPTHPPQFDGLRSIKYRPWASDSSSRRGVVRASGHAVVRASRKCNGRANKGTDGKACRCESKCRTPGARFVIGVTIADDTYEGAARRDADKKEHQERARERQAQTMQQHGCEQYLHRAGDNHRKTAPPSKMLRPQLI